MSKRLEAVLFAFAASSILLGCSMAQKTADLAAIASSVQHRDGSTGTQTDVSPGSSQTMHEGDGIRVDQQGKGEVTFAGCTVEIYWGTKMTLKTTSAPGCVFALEQGTLQVNVQSGTEATVDTPWATITSFGTQFFVYVGLEQRVVWVIVRDGHVRVSNELSTVTLSPGWQTWVLPGQAPVDPLPATRQAVQDLAVFPLLTDLTSYGPPDRRRFDLTDEVWLPPQMTPGGTITLWHSWGEAEVPALNNLLAAFQAENPGIRLDVQYLPADALRDRFQAAAAAGAGPAVLMAPADWGPALYQAGLVADLSTTASPDLLRSTIPLALDTVRYRSALVGLPHTLKGVVMYRNRSITPQPPNTFDELLRMAKEASQGDVVGADLERGFFFSAAHLNGIGGQLMDDNGNPTFYGQKGVEWVNLLRAFSAAGPAEYNTDEDLRRFQAGQAGIIIDATWNLEALRNAIGAENLSIDPWPAVGEGHLSGYVQSDALYLNAVLSGDDQEAALRFIEFFLSPDSQARLTRVGHIPAIAGVPVDDPLLRQALEAFRDGTPFPALPEMQAYWGPMDTALQSAFEQRGDPNAALETAYGEIIKTVDAMHAGP